MQYNKEKSGGLPEGDDAEQSLILETGVRQIKKKEDDF